MTHLSSSTSEHAAIKHQAEVRTIVRWLVDQGFPYNWSTTFPAPAFLRPLLAEEYARREGDPPEMWLDSLDAEQEWA